jgi:hypothetical protein
VSRFAPCPTCGHPIAAGVRCPYCAAGRDEKPAGPTLWRREEEKRGFTGCPDRRQPTAWQWFLRGGFGPPAKELQRTRRLAEWRAKHLAPAGTPGLFGALRVSGRRGWGNWRPGIGWIDGDRLWWRRWLLPATVSLSRREIATVEVRPVRGLEVARLWPGYCIWTLIGPGWVADIALEPPDEGVLQEWLLAGHLRPTRRG